MDLDGVEHYFALHGLPLPDAAERRRLYRVGLERIRHFAQRGQIPLTLFAVGQDLGDAGAAALLAALSSDGHAVENHSASHVYDLADRAPQEIRGEIRRASDAIERVTGRRPRGFRAPGYRISPSLLDALEDESIHFDSSVFPCPIYFAAKAAAIGALRLRGRATVARLDRVAVLRAPTQPYRPDRSGYSSGKRRLVELPIQVTPRLRLPLIGSFLGLAGPAVSTKLVASCRRQPMVNIELHLIDFLDLKDGLNALAPFVTELGVSLRRRERVITRVIEQLRSDGRSFKRLADVADETARSLS